MIFNLREYHQVENECNYSERVPNTQIYASLSCLIRMYKLQRLAPPMGNPDPRETDLWTMCWKEGTSAQEEPGEKKDIPKQS